MPDFKDKMHEIQFPPPTRFTCELTALSLTF